MCGIPFARNRQHNTPNGNDDSVAQSHGHTSTQWSGEADALARALADDEREPEPATWALLKVVSDDGAPGQAPTDTSMRLVAELIGREQQSASLMAAWDASAHGAAATDPASCPSA